MRIHQDILGEEPDWSPDDMSDADHDDAAGYEDFGGDATVKMEVQYTSAKEPNNPQKGPMMYPQKSPTYPQKGPMHPQKNPTHQDCSFQDVF